MDFMTVPLSAAELDEPRQLGRKAPSSWKNGSNCQIDRRIRVRQTAQLPAPHPDPFLVHRPPPRLPPAGRFPPLLQQTPARRRSPLWFAARHATESDATVP